MGVLREMQAESEAAPEQGGGDEATDYVRAKIATIRRNVRQFQTRQQSGAGAGPGGAGQQSGEPASENGA